MTNPIFPTPFPNGFRLIDGGALNRLFQQDGPVSSENTITASAAETRVAGTAILATYNRVSVAGATDAVTLMGAGGRPQAGQAFFIANDSGQAIQVFPPGATDTIDGGTAGASIAMANALRAWFLCVAVSNAGVATWVSFGATKSA